MSSAAASHPVIVLTTLAADADATALARTLVEQGLAACVSILPPMTSMYRWEGTLQQDREQQILIKTVQERLPELERRLHQLHSYEVPEFLVIPVLHGSDRYLQWLAASATPTTGDSAADE